MKNSFGKKVNTANLHIYPASMKHQTRILKETKSLAGSGLFNKIYIVGIWERGTKEHEKLDSKREVWRVPLRSHNISNGSIGKIIKYTEWQLRIFFRFKKENITFINCHCLSTLPIGLFFKMFLRSNLVYDTHELETEVIGSAGIRKKIAQVVEKLLIPFADIIFAVSDSIANWYKNQYNLKEVHIIRNIPNKHINKSEISDILKAKFSVQEDEILFIYQGLLSEGRGIEILLNAFSKIDKRKQVVFMGFGELKGLIQEFEKNFSNIHLHPPVTPDNVIPYTKSADVGISLIENICLSYYYSLPNKIFEYILSGLPLIVSDFPDMGKIVDECKCGWKVRVDEKTVMDLVNNISKEDVQEKRNNVINCIDNFRWEEEEEKLLRAYNSMLNK